MHISLYSFLTLRNASCVLHIQRPPLCKQYSFASCKTPETIFGRIASLPSTLRCRLSIVVRHIVMVRNAENAAMFTPPTRQSIMLLICVSIGVAADNCVWWCRLACCAASLYADWMEINNIHICNENNQQDNDGRYNVWIWMPSRFFTPCAPWWYIYVDIQITQHQVWHVLAQHIA